MLHLGGATAEGDEGREQRQQQQQQRQPQCDGETQRPGQGVELAGRAAGAMGLGGQAGGGHPQEAEQPEQQVDEGGPNRHAAEEPGLAEMTDHPGVHQPQQRGGDIGKDHGQGEGKHGAMAPPVSPPGGGQHAGGRPLLITIRHPAALSWQSPTPCSPSPPWAPRPRSDGGETRLPACRPD